MEDVEYEMKGKYMTINKNIKNKWIKFKHFKINENNIFPSEEELFHVQNKLPIKDDDVKTNDNNDNKELSDNGNINDNNNINSNNIEINNLNNDNINNEEKKGFLGKSLDWINYIVHEIPLFWKKEELVKGYDANGNIVFRPKNKIPTKKKINVDIDKMNAENEANSASVDYSTKGINYGILFN